MGHVDVYSDVWVCERRSVLPRGGWRSCLLCLLYSPSSIPRPPRHRLPPTRDSGSAGDNKWTTGPVLPSRGVDGDDVVEERGPGARGRPRAEQLFPSNDESSRGREDCPGNYKVPSNGGGDEGGDVGDPGRTVYSRDPSLSLGPWIRPTTDVTGDLQSLQGRRWTGKVRSKHFHRFVLTLPLGPSVHLGPYRRIP